MKPVRTPESNTVLELPGGGRDADLPATQAMLTDSSRPDRPPALGWITIWQPDDHEARRLEAGACVELVIWGQQHPPVAVSVTQAVVPERELIDRGHVDRALGLLYARLSMRIATAIVQLQAEDIPAAQLVDTGGDPNPEAVGLPDPSTMADLWIECVTETAPAPPTEQDQRLADMLDGLGRPAAASPTDPDDIACAGCDAEPGKPCNLIDPWNPVDRMCNRQAAQAAQKEE